MRYAEPTDLVSAEVGLKARHLLCRLAVKDIVNKKSLPKDAIAEAADAVDEALYLARQWKFLDRADLAKPTREIFRFGCRIYESSQPYFLAEFLMECLAPEAFDGAIVSDEDTFDAARAAIWSALGNLQPDGFQFIATSDFGPFLADIRELRKVEERLEELRQARLAGKP